jgi:hypothetical protein
MSLAHWDVAPKAVKEKILRIYSADERAPRSITCAMILISRGKLP